MSRQRRKGGRKLTVGARANNLKNIDVGAPRDLYLHHRRLGRRQVLLLNQILYPALANHFTDSEHRVGEHDRSGLEHIDKVIAIDQQPIGRTPRSNPATYTKAWDEIRKIFSMTREAKLYGYGPGRFSFNVKGGRCEACEGDGVRKVEMHFLSDVYVPCEVCHGLRFNEQTLRVRYKDKTIADVLQMSVREAYTHFSVHTKLRKILQTLLDVGLDYIKLASRRRRSRAARPSASNCRASSPAARPAAPSTSSTSPRPGCTSTTCASYSTCSDVWSTAATP